VLREHRKNLVWENSNRKRLLFFDFIFEKKIIFLRGVGAYKL
jgi:hypothetical protein